MHALLRATAASILQAAAHRARAERWFWAPMLAPLTSAYSELRACSCGGVRVVLLRAGGQAARAGRPTALVRVS